MFSLVRLSLLYLTRYRRRYLFLFIALAFGYGIITFITSVKDRMADNIYFSAQAHYAGDLIADAYDDTDETHRMGGTDVERIMAAADRAEIDPARTARRTNLFNDTILFFNGNAVSIKYLLGVDYEAERPYFEALSYVDSGTPPSSLSRDGILLSAPVADFLGARRGDSLVLQLRNNGVTNTGSFVITAVIDDSSFFGYYKAYINRRTLNGLINFKPDDCSTVGFFLKDRAQLVKKQRALNEELAKDLPVFPLIFNRDDFERERDKSDPFLRVMLLTIPVYLSEISQLLGAMDLLGYFLYAMMLLIIMVSASVTYRLILHERKREIGTMRAIGFYEAEVRRLLLAEIFWLGLCSLIAGFLFTRLLSWGLSRISFDWFPSFEIFMRNGKLTALYRPLSTAVNGLAVFALLFLAAYFPLYRSSRHPLPEMLGGTV